MRRKKRARAIAAVAAGGREIERTSVRVCVCEGGGECTGVCVSALF